MRTADADDLGSSRLPWTRRLDRDILMMTNSDKERGEKRGVLSTGQARKLEDADADAADDYED
ncbi:hypothetical protein SAMN04489841_1427 [Natrinema salaciae]|uniref:Uncharacterized protein n=1 Tax=Natrinema salaciae TaxID=1186196 RepID=A0A1H9F1M1_9EURY|nr:hypothetical protein SAMN04489841_1427 [Natrinema salaciae]